MDLVALTLCLIFSTWFIARDVMQRKGISYGAIWLPTLLFMVLGSRPVSVWLGGAGPNAPSSGLSNDAQVNSIDQGFFILVIFISLIIVSMRKVNWRRIFNANKALIAFYAFFAVSILWSLDPSGSAKRLIKDFGMLFAILVVFTEKNPMEATRALFVRSAAVLFPLSILFIKYYPDWGRSYSIAGDPMYTGVTTQKNSLGEIALICIIFLVWDFIELRRASGKRFRFPWDRALLALVGFSLLRTSQSKSGLLCTIIAAILIIRSGRFNSKFMNYIIFPGALAMPFLLFFSQQFSSVIAPIVEALGRNMTFTGRTEIWAHITSNTVNPWIGCGYWNFWGGPGGRAITVAMNTPVPNAHCGYIDIYLDGGILGLFMLFVLLFANGRSLIKKISTRLDEDRYLRVRFAFLIVAIVYNLSESTFARIGPIWFTTLLMLVDFPFKKAVPKLKREQAVEPLPPAEPVPDGNAFAS